MFLVSNTTPPFEALYALPPAVPSRPSILASVTIEPRSPSTRGCSIILATAALATRNVPVRFDCDYALPFGTVEQMDRPATCDTRGMDNAVESTWYRGEYGRDGRFVRYVGHHETRTGRRGPRRARPHRPRPQCRPRPAV